MKRYDYVTTQTLTIFFVSVILAASIAIYFPHQIGKTAEGDLRSHAMSLTAVLGALVAASVDFDQAQHAQSQIAALEGDPSLRYALVLKKDGARFAHFATKTTKAEDEVLETANEPRLVTKSDFLHISLPLRRDSSLVGTLTMGFSRESVLSLHRSSRLAAFSIAFLVFSIGLMLSWITVVRKKAEEQKEKFHAQLAQSEKLAAIGQLAGGVAHEINNPLGVILGFAQGLDSRVPEGDLLRLPVASIVREALRCKVLVQELLTFSRIGKREAERVDCNVVINSAAVLLESRAKTHNVDVVRKLAESLPPIMANKTQIEQVVVNLGNNALDAMGQRGTLTLRTRRDTNTVVLDIADTGTGIPDEIRTRIFEPFFTTKEVGKGTGLGLSLVHEIVTQHGGSVDVQSEVGCGTTMSVRLPIYENAKGCET